MNLPDFLIQDEDGEIHPVGSRIGLYHVVHFYNEGYSPEMLVCEFPTLPLALIHKIIAFYLENQVEVDKYVADYRAELERQRAAHVPGPGELRLRRLMELLRQADADHGSDPEWLTLSVVEKLRRLGEIPPPNIL